MNTSVLENLKEVLSDKETHFFDRADALATYKSVYGLSERALGQLVGKSKSEIHRLLDVARTDNHLRSAALYHGTDYHVLVRYWQTTPENQYQMYDLILNGNIKRHKQATSFLATRAPSKKESIKRKIHLLEAQLKKCKMELERCA